ncbi:MAG: putative secreted protein [Proteiniphilum sp.]|jgi:hypothetical protein|nr:putative secreted protein [Proteiniphilum sp.]MDK2852965.1 hypothetical protein [Proteiniphilum sp.]
MVKRLVLLISLICSISTLHAQFEGTWGVGVHAGYASAAERPGAGVHLHYYLTNNLRFVPSYTRFLERKGEGLWMAETDLHYILPLSYAASLYPLAGVHYSNWHYDPTAAGAIAMEEHTNHRLGASLGLGFQHDISYRVRANLELKYQFINDYSQLLLTAGFGFWF